MYNSTQQPAPPVNNLLQPDIYNRLDAEVIERTRVVNTQLDERLRAQKKLLAKYRLAAERCHRQEKDRVRAELRQISTKLPAVGKIRDFRNKFLHGEGLVRNSTSQSLPELPVRKIRGIPQGRPDLPFCLRCYIHHLPSKKKYYRAPTPSPLPALHGTEVTGEGEVEKVTLPPPAAANETTPLVTTGSVNGADHTRLTPTDSLWDKTDPPTGLHGVRSYTDTPERTSPVRRQKNPAGGEDVPGRPSSLPHFQKDNIKLAQSSPQLVQG